VNRCRFHPTCQPFLGRPASGWCNGRANGHNGQQTPYRFSISKQEYDVKILFASSEAQPLIKTGGLADVSGSLPVALSHLGEDVRLILPAYRGVLEKCEHPESVAALSVPGTDAPVEILESRLPNSDVVSYLVHSPRHFDRPGGPYSGTDGHDWPDNAERFAVFDRAACAVAQGQAGINWGPELVHCNDWQTGLVPALLELGGPRPATVFTIHNLAYQGLFSWDVFQKLALPYELWSMYAMEFYNQLSFIKGGLVYADRLTTVSPTYAREIRTPEFGCGLEGLLDHRGHDLYGILNGVDYAAWNPDTDPLIPHNYDVGKLAGKAGDKTALQRRLGLPQHPDVPLIGMVGRLVEQKGIDLLVAVLDRLLGRRAQLALLGSGHKRFEDALSGAAEHYPSLGVQIGYDEQLAHLIEAGSDLFLMPSRFEPCGLNQMYSLRYGTLPVVRRTGGLADTVVDADRDRLETGTATGFVFHEAEPEALYGCLQRALALYRKPDAWRRMMDTAMAQDFSWERSARNYLDLYRDALEDRR
jgi:starch synthase